MPKRGTQREKHSGFPCSNPEQLVSTIAALLGGGTYFRVGVRRFSSDGAVTDLLSAELHTRDAQSTLNEARALLAPFDLDAAGVSMFGPIVLNGPARGTIGTTPKPGWEGAQVLDVFGIPRSKVGLDTDVGGAAIAELTARSNVQSLAYVTVGTGVGGALAVRDAQGTADVFRGQWHSEMGHLMVPQLGPKTYPGACPYHGACVEGLASGPAIEAIAGAASSTLDDGHPAFEVVTTALFHLAQALTLIASPEVIVFGGGVIEKRPFLRQKIANSFATQTFRLAPPRIGTPIHSRPGLEGAFLLGLRISKQVDRRHDFR